MSEWDDEVQIKAYQDFSQVLLQRFELYMKTKALSLQTQSEDTSFTQKLIARILDNLQVSIKYVYFRFEDYINLNSLEGQGIDRKNSVQEKFALGLKVKEFLIYSTDKNNNKIEKVENK